MVYPRVYNIGAVSDGPLTGIKQFIIHLNVPEYDETMRQHHTERTRLQRASNTSILRLLLCADCLLLLFTIDHQSFIISVVCRLHVKSSFFTQRHHQSSERPLYCPSLLFIIHIYSIIARHYCSSYSIILYNILKEIQILLWSQTTTSSM